MDDLTPILRKVEKILKEEFGDTPGIVLIFSNPSDYKTGHLISNVKAADTINMITTAKDKLFSQFN